ncbi:hypothetical protein [Salinisphaera sp. T31B1]|uniref:hypothetical protein n=1 Tax=Salinisphaera sp. T31B1 TaxID=727963 RepID=UPI0033426354
MEDYSPAQMRAVEQFTRRIAQFSKKDLNDAELAIAGLDDAYGSVIPIMGQRRMQDGRQPWVLQKVSSEEMGALWRCAGMPTGPESDYQAMLDADNEYRCVRMDLIKYKASLFSRTWLGTIALMYGDVKVILGTIRGSTQTDLWLKYRRVLDYDTNLLHDSVFDALRAV